jgi:UDP-N-acetyl-D-glucosamine dehydrogenase
MNLLNEIKERNARIGVIGLGYVGLPLVLALSKAGFAVWGFDTDEKKVKALNSGRSYLKHISSQNIKAVREQGNFEATDDFSLPSSLYLYKMMEKTVRSNHESSHKTFEMTSLL